VILKKAACWARADWAVRSGEEKRDWGWAVTFRGDRRHFYDQEIKETLGEETRSRLCTSERAKTEKET